MAVSTHVRGVDVLAPTTRAEGQVTREVLMARSAATLTGAAGERDERRGGALVAVFVIGAITLAWWALALWPAGTVEPEWLARTRVACFGARNGGLPDAGGWILLIGEPIGMLFVLVTVFGRSLRADLAVVARSRFLRVGTVGLTLAGVAMAVVLGVRVLEARGIRSELLDAGVVLTRIDLTAPSVPLVDDLALPTNLRRLGGGPRLLTLAYGHCATVCPVVVSELIAARRAAHRDELPILVLTLDPWRDTPDRLPTLAKHWGIGRQDRVLSGDTIEVNRALDALGISRSRDLTNGDIGHTRTVFVLSGTGQLVWRADGSPRALDRFLAGL